MTAGLEAVYYATSPVLSAIGSDVVDIAVIKFPVSTTRDFFHDTAYDLSKPSIAISDAGDNLIFYGAITELSSLTDKTVVAQFVELQFEDIGCHPSDPVLRSAKAFWNNLTFSNISGISGGPVYNSTKGGICGMAVRGGLLQSGHANAHYVDIQDICRLLQNIHSGTSESHYTKVTKR